MGRDRHSWSRPYERALYARQFVVTAVPIACYFLPVAPASLWAILYLAVAATGLNFTYYLLHLRGWFPRTCHWLRLILDISLWTLLLHYTGGPRSLFFSGYLVEVMLSAVALSAAGCLGAAAFSSAGFVLLVLREPAAAADQVVTRLLILAVAGVLSWSLVRMLEEKNRLVASENRKLNRMTEAIRRESEQLRRRLERQEWNGRVGQAAAEMAHELRNTVHGLQGFVGLLKEDLNGLSRGSDLVDRIDTGIREMERMAEDILASRPTDSRQPEPVDLGPLLREAIAYGADGHPVQVRLREPDGKLPSLLGHREILRASFINLIRNARQAMTNGGHLLIGVSADGMRGITIRFRDDGPGVPQQIRDRLFQPFVTGGNGGTGLGLALARRGVESHGGTLDLESTGTAGTIMKVWLPVPEAVPAAGGGAP